MRSLRILFAGMLMPILAVLTSCSNSNSTPAAKADFTLAATPTAASLTGGGAGQTVTVTAAATNGFTGTVAVVVSGLPSGVTATPATLSLAAGMPQTVTLMAASSATAGAATVTITGTSGTLSHATSVAVTVVPPPDFTLTVTPASLAVTAGGAAGQVSVRADAVNGFTSSVAVALAGLPTGVTASPASVTLTPGAAQTIALTAAAPVPSSTATVTFTGTASGVTHAASLALTLQAAQAAAAPDVTTYHYNVSRDGLNAKETTLTPANVNATSFGKVNFLTVDGKVDAEPLYLANLTVGGAAHNVLYVASEHGSVYAFDADSGTQLWKTSVIPTGEMTSDDHGCTQITTEIGITSTPVIDRSFGAHGTLFTVGMSKETNGTYHQRLHALDITTGAETAGSPTEVTATYPGTGDFSSGGNVVFDPGQYAERAALLLSNGTIYTGWTSHCDAGQYTGWVMAYSESTLKQTSVLNLTPNGKMGSVWMSGNGLAADSSGNLYLLAANGTFDTTLTNGMPSNGNYGNAMLKLTNTGGKLTVADYFAEYNTVANSAADLDLGSGGELLFDATDTGGRVHHLIVGAGKDKVIYVGNRDNLGHFNPSNTAPNSNLYQMVTGQLAGLNYTTPAYFNGVLYYGSDGDNLKAFPVTNAVLATTASSHSAATFAHPGTTPAVSANGTKNGIVWAVESGTNQANVLHAYDPTNLANEFYNSNQAGSGRDAFGNGNKFITPLVINGKVYVGTTNGVAVFGLLPK
jgi:outer membrane protein assembly factor BamB